MKLLVCGGRDYADAVALCDRLDAIANEADLVVLIVGDANGADMMARKWAKLSRRVVAIHHYAADWRNHGPAAGPMRNQRMLDEGKPDLVVAFSGGRGTADMVRRARAAGVKVIEVTR